MKSKLIYIFFLLSSVLYSQNDRYNLVREYYGVEILFDNKTKSYSLEYHPEKGNPVKINKLKFAQVIFGVRFQVLTKNCDVKYYNSRLEEIKLEPFVVCGFNSSFNPHYEIITHNEYFYIVKDTIKLIDFEEKIVHKKIDSIKKNKIDNIYFINNHKTIKELSGLPTIPIVEKNGKKGILKNGKAKLYDNLELIGTFIRLTENDLKFYYGISNEAKYIKLEQFEQELAFFIDQNNKQGYIDKNGKEYNCSK